MPNFHTSDGVSIAYYVHGTDTSQPPVVLHHGFAASAASNWERTGVIAALVAAGRAVIAVDARGHGASQKSADPAHYGEPRMAQDLIELLDHLRIAQFDLFGYSMGAVVSLLVASSNNRVRRLVIGGVGEGVLVSGGVDMRVMNRGAIADALRAIDPANLTHPGAAMFRAFAQRMGADLPSLAAQAQRMHASPIPLDRIAAPTLVLAGRDDVLAVHPERLAAAIPGAECIVVDGDHLGAVALPAMTQAAVAFLNATPKSAVL